MGHWAHSFFEFYGLGFPGRTVCLIIAIFVFSASPAQAQGPGELDNQVSEAFKSAWPFQGEGLRNQVTENFYGIWTFREMKVEEARQQVEAAPNVYQKMWVDSRAVELNATVKNWSLAGIEIDSHPGRKYFKHRARAELVATFILEEEVGPDDDEVLPLVSAELLFKVANLERIFDQLGNIVMKLAGDPKLKGIWRGLSPYKFAQRIQQLSQRLIKAKSILEAGQRASLNRLGEVTDEISSLLSNADENNLGAALKRADIASGGHENHQAFKRARVAVTTVGPMIRQSVMSAELDTAKLVKQVKAKTQMNKLPPGSATPTPQSQVTGAIQKNKSPFAKLDRSSGGNKNSNGTSSPFAALDHRADSPDTQRVSSKSPFAKMDRSRKINNLRQNVLRQQIEKLRKRLADLQGPSEWNYFVFVKNVILVRKEDPEKKRRERQEARQKWAKKVRDYQKWRCPKTRDCEPIRESRIILATPSYPTPIAVSEAVAIRVPRQTIRAEAGAKVISRWNENRTKAIDARLEIYTSASEIPQQSNEHGRVSMAGFPRSAYNNEKENEVQQEINELRRAI